MFNRWFSGPDTPTETPPPTPVEQRNAPAAGGGWLGGWFSGEQPAGEPVECVLPELPSPQTPEDYVSLIKERTNLFKSLLEAQDWNDIGFFDAAHTDVKVWDKVIADSNVHLVRSSARMPCSPERLLKNLYCADVAELKRWDPDLNSTTVVEQMGEKGELQVIYQTYNAPFPVTNRSFLCVRGVEREENGTIWLVALGINRKDFPEVPGFVRGAVILAGWKITPIEGEVEACFQDRIVQLDPKGLIPLMIVNLFKKKAGESLVTQRRVFAGELGPVPE